MIPTREPIPTYTFLNPVSLLHGVYVTFSISLTNYFVIVFTSCGKWLGRNIIQRVASRWSNENLFTYQ